MTVTARAEVLSRIRIPTLKRSTTRILELGNDPEASARDYAQIVEADPGLSTTVLKLVNSALYSLPNRVVDIKGACVLLGLRNLNSICLSAALVQEMRREGSSTVSQCWLYCLSTGHVARRTAFLAAPRAEVPAFLAGLLSGIGVIALLGSNEFDYSGIIETARARDCDWAAVEEEVLGCSNAQIARDIMERWKLQPEACEMVEECNQVDGFSSAGSWAVALASIIVQLRAPEFSMRANLDAAWSRVTAQFPDAWEQIEPELEGIMNEAELQRQLLG